MNRLTKAKGQTYYIDSPTKVGVYIEGRDVILIDSGNDRDAGRKIDHFLEENDLNLTMIINTHSHADHIGGNRILQQRHNCEIYSVEPEVSLIKNPIIEPSYLFGGYPSKTHRNKFLMAEPSEASEINEEVLPEGFEIINLDGHSFAMIGIKTPDNCCFLADALNSERTIEKYHVPFLYDIEKYLLSLDTIEALEGDLFIPSHAEVVKDPQTLIDLNRAMVFNVIDVLKEICTEKKTFDSVLKEVFDHYKLKLNDGQYVLVGSTIKSYLSYLVDKEELAMVCKDNYMHWERV